MEIQREIGEKGQVVIPKDIREYLGLRRRQKVIFEVRGKENGKEREVTLKKAEDPEKFMNEFFNPKFRKKNITLKELKKIEDESYDLP